MRNVPISVVNLRSLSYTGTTWINVVLGSHPEAFATGPPDRFAELWARAPGKLCLVHGAGCPFWPSFCRRYDPGKNFFVQLAEATGRRVIVINNPVPAGMGRELEHPAVTVRAIHVVRDGRAVAASYARRFKEPFAEVVRDWYAPAAPSIAFGGRGGRYLSVRYEDFVAQPAEKLAEIGRFVGLEYTTASLRYWEYEHHPVMGNQGLIALIRLHQGLPVGAIEGAEHYRRQQEAEAADPLRPRLDERWRAQLTAEDLYAFDALCGAHNAKLGYPREKRDPPKKGTWFLFRARRRIAADLRRIAAFAGRRQNAQLASVAAHYATRDVVRSYVHLFRQLVADRVPRFGASTGLDFGCWFGLSTLILRHLGARRVVGADVNGRFIEAARAWLAELGIGGLEFVLIPGGQLGQVPLADASMDWIVANHAFSNALPGRYPAILADIRRLLRPGGLFLFSEANNPHHAPTAERLRQTYREYEIGEGTALEPAGAYFRLRLRLISESFPQLGGDAALRFSRETAYRWGDEIRGYVQARLDGGEAQPTCFEPGALRVPVHPLEGTTIGAVTDPLELEPLFAEAGFTTETLFGLPQGPHRSRDENLRATGQYYIVARPA